MEISSVSYTNKIPPKVVETGQSLEVSHRYEITVDGNTTRSREQLEKEIGNLNKFLQTSNTHLKFTLHEELNEYYVQIIDDQTQEVVREVPSKKILDLVAKIHEMIGLLVDEKR
ncbi:MULTISPECIES: flagellar protein FlaG [Brevibacillus]|jgi:flagellar protein FlaG|uniref:flagellar protein FlaG n=1 Tax=Brevibacillus TaxID=55080 RepID=UPI001E469803|nr:MULTISPECIES: flagellar protein FlaG [Bacillales]MDT3417895.1 flagellar protein FlaG [Brevibacillus aydinogluensis]UFJ61946.1 flagellar protein FlaG [Anoxybacillus sediminis]